MGLCCHRIAEGDGSITEKVIFCKHAAINFALAIRMCGLVGNFKSDEWIKETIKQASETAEFYFDNILPQIEDSTQRVYQAALFASDISEQPCHELVVKVDKMGAFLCFDLITDLIRGKEYNLVEPFLQQLLTFFTRANDRYSMQEQPDATTERDLKLFKADYDTSKDIIAAWKALDEGFLIKDYAMKEIESGDVQSALNVAWNALDKFKEAEHLSEGLVDELYYQSKTAKAYLYLNVFKNEKKAKKLYKEILQSSASENFKNAAWMEQCRKNFDSLEARDPAFQKQKMQEMIKPDVERIKDEVKSAGKDIQRIINFVFKNFPPIPNKSGTMKLKPSISKLGEQKAIRKMVYSYHPDKIDKSDLRYKMLCEEITKVFTELLDS